MCKFYIPLLLANCLANNFCSYRIDSILLGQKLEFTRRAGIATRQATATLDTFRYTAIFVSLTTKSQR